MCKNIFAKIACFAVLLLAAGCDDMKLQTDAEYNGSVLDPHINMTAWEYFESRSDISSDFMPAIAHAGMRDSYTQTGHEYTFLALTNTAISTFVNSYGTYTSITEVPVEDVKNLLLYHIVDGRYSGYGELQVEAMFVLTLRRGEQGLMTMLTRKNPWMAHAGAITVNDTGTNGNSPLRHAVSSNIMPTNGVIHVFDDYCYYKK